MLFIFVFQLSASFFFKRMCFVPFLKVYLAPFFKELYYISLKIYQLLKVCTFLNLKKGICIVPFHDFSGIKRKLNNVYLSYEPIMLHSEPVILPLIIRRTNEIFVHVFCKTCILLIVFFLR